MSASAASHDDAYVDVILENPRQHFDLRVRLHRRGPRGRPVLLTTLSSRDVQQLLDELQPDPLDRGCS